MMLYFLTPDEPSAQGGIRVIYDFATYLDEHGVPAAVWHGQKGFRCGLDSAAPLVHGRHLGLEAGDLLVVPEFGVGQWEALTRGAPKVVLNQGHFLTIEGLGAGRELTGRYPGAREAVAAIATSRAIKGFLDAICEPGFPVHEVPVPLDTRRFTPGVKEPVVAWMPRRRPAEMRLVVAALRRRGKLRGWSFVAIDGMSATEVADVLARTSIFLLGNERDGLGLPGLEAMSAGCHTVGFLGGGGREYADYPLLSPIDDGEILHMIQRVEEVASTMDSTARQAATAQTRAMIVRDHDPAFSAARLTEVCRELLAPGSPAVVSKPVRVAHLETWGATVKRFVRRGLRATETAARGLLDSSQP